MIGQLPAGFPVRRRGSCVPAAYLIAKQIAPCNIIYGRVGVRLDEHTWVEAGGKIIDPTIRQFSWWREGVPVRRVIVERKPRDEFIDLFEWTVRAPWWVSEAGAHYRDVLASVPTHRPFGVSAIDRSQTSPCFHPGAVRGRTR